MKIIYNRETDIVSIIFMESEVAESDEIREGIIIDYDFKGKICALEVLDTSEFISSKGDLVSELIPEITVN